MRRGLLAGVMGLASAAGSAAGQGVEFRIVERQGQQAIVTPVGTTATTDAVLNFAIQARVVGGANAALGNFQFNVHIVGEPEANGTLTKMLISNANGTYAANTAQSNNATVGRGGIARPYTFLAGITNGFFNGLINFSGGSFTNGPDQEILAITGSPTGGAILDVTDADGDGNPDTYSGMGMTAALDPAVAKVYFGVGGNWWDLYRFKYVVTNTATSRALHIVLDTQGAGNQVEAQVFDHWALANGVWGPGNPVNASVVVTGLDVSIGSVGACCDTATGICTITDGAGCPAGTFAASGMCTPSPCPVSGACCVVGGTCTVGVPSACGGQWTLGGSCEPNVCTQPMVCCDLNGACVVTASCTQLVAILGSSCSPNPCPQPGACCNTDGSCSFVVRNECSEGWMGGSCSPTPCRSGSCCRLGVACEVATQAMCSGVWVDGGACGASSCPSAGKCCQISGACEVTYQATCGAAWTAGGTCGTSACPVLGACCQRAACSVIGSGACAAVHGQYRGDGVACLPAGTFNACCIGNFDGENGLGISDIFLFLSTWFAGDLRADMDQTGVLNIGDIFTFIGEWRNGC